MYFRNMKIAFHTLGCKLNYSETSFIANNLKDEGVEITDFSEKSDVYVINTCSVTENANKECKQIIKKIKKKSPNSIITVMGCYAQLKPNEIKNIEGVNLVLGANEKFKLKEYLKNTTNKDSSVIVQPIEKITSFKQSFSEKHRTRTFLKVQDGCNYKCSFCTIPLARGKSRSNTIKNVLQEIHELKNKGIKEIVLTGVNIGDFGINGNNESFLDLLKEIIKIPSVRIRISSIEPNLLSEEILDVVLKSKNIVPHFHIPLQSGSDKILKLMRRRYNTRDYKALINKIKKYNSSVCIGADVIVGFPGEEETDFNDTVNFIKSLPLSYLHVFSYSERDNTIAQKLAKSVPKEERKKRSLILRNLSEKKKNIFYLENLKTSRLTLIEGKTKKEYLNGYTDNYIKIEIPYKKEFENKILNIKMEALNKNGNVTGTIIQNEEK